jgi:hypothetical protein
MQKTPFSTDAVRAATNLEAAARSKVLVGAYDEAVSDLTQLLERPSYISVDVLRIDPWFETLRQTGRLRGLLAH